MNHDLIAAGHPRLNFELVSHSDRMPRHWDQEKIDAIQAARGLPGREPARDWAIGQLATLGATLEVLAGRARGPEDMPDAPPWPEFSEFACYSCHHSLVDGGLHYSRGRAVPGAPTWASWTLPMSRALIDQIDGRMIGPIDSLDRLMGEPFPDRDRVADGADRLLIRIDQQCTTLGEMGFDGDDLRLLLSNIAGDRGKFEEMTSNWDGAAQFFLACRALVRAESVDLLRSGRIRAEDLERIRGDLQALRDLGDALDLEEGLDSPGPRGEPSPWSDPPDPIVGAMERLLDRLALAGKEPRGGENAPDGK